MMVGRDRELKVLTKLAASDQPRVALIAGEPGIGKTRLTNELLATLPSEHVVLVGHAEPGSLSRPYEVLLGAVRTRTPPQTPPADPRHWAVGRRRPHHHRRAPGQRLACRVRGDRRRLSSGVSAIWIT
jgi:hypothetical protein